MHRFLHKCLSDPFQLLQLSLSLISISRWILFFRFLSSSPSVRIFVDRQKTRFRNSEDKAGEVLPSTAPRSSTRFPREPRGTDSHRDVGGRRKVKEGGMGKCMAVARGKDDSAQTAQANANRVTISTDSLLRVYL